MNKQLFFATWILFVLTLRAQGPTPTSNAKSLPPQLPIPGFWSPQVYQGFITAIGTILATLIAIRVAQRFQVQEGVSRAEPSLNVVVFAKCLRRPAEVEMLTLETRIEVTNNSRRTCCLPAVYVSVRALSPDQDHPGTDFYELPECGTLREVRNVARSEGTVTQVAPDEIEHFVRWDTLHQSFAERFPVIVVNVEVFGADLKHLGEWHYTKPWWTSLGALVGMPYRNNGEYRNKWLEFVESENGIRHTYCMFSRWQPSTHPERDPLRPFQRYLRSPDGKPDLPNSLCFADVLSNVVRWNRGVTVVLNNFQGGDGTKG